MTLAINDVLVLRAGPEARARIAADGISPDLFSTMLGASGGPKWLILAGLDRFLAGEFFRARTAPLALLGTSIGSWRHAYFARRDPLAALDCFLDAYLQQRYSARPTVAELTREAERLLGVLLGEHGRQEIVAHPVFRTHIIAARCRGLTRSEQRAPLLAGLVLAALLNTVSRRTLALQFERVMFASHAGSAFRLDGAPARHAPLDEANLVDALLATAAVPMVFAPRRDIAGAPPGVYRDGGITDYHFDLAIEAPPGLVLYPHFYPHITPGWFDKMLRWRRPHGALAARTLLVAPAPQFTANLPGRAIPDRRDFARHDDDTREGFWRAAVNESARLGEAFAAWCRDPEPARWLTPL